MAAAADPRTLLAADAIRRLRHPTDSRFLAAPESAEIHSSPRLFTDICPVSPGGVQETPVEAVAAPISSPIGGYSRHHAPRLASYLSRAGPGIWEL